MSGWRWPLLVSGRPFGFVALLGVIALMGMIQRNSVIIIDQSNEDRTLAFRHGKRLWNPGVRLRPIVLTAAAAVLAMITVSRSCSGGPWR